MKQSVFMLYEQDGNDWDFIGVFTSDTKAIGAIKVLSENTLTKNEEDELTRTHQTLNRNVNYRIEEVVLNKFKHE